MHDWTLVSMILDWEESSFLIKFLNNKSCSVDIICQGIKFINIPKWDKWGESISVNTFNLKDDTTFKKLEIEMQSGDVITIIANDIEMPK